MKYLTLVCAAALTFAQAGSTSALRIYVIDVEGGGATLVVSPSGQSMLIDSGSPAPAADRDSARIAGAMKAVPGVVTVEAL